LIENGELIETRNYKNEVVVLNKDLFTLVDSKELADKEGRLRELNAIIENEVSEGKEVDILFSISVPNAGTMVPEVSELKLGKVL
jgi:hypothetical protein